MFHFVLTHRFFLVFGLFLGLSMSAQTAFAIATNLTDGDMPIKITADDMVYDMDKSTVTFIGQVEVVRGEFVMNSNKMRIFMLKDKEKKGTQAPPIDNIPLTGEADVATGRSGSANNIERIEAYQGMSFVYGAQSGQSREATYNALTGVLTMTGNPLVREGENTIQGDVIRYYMNERRSEVIGSKDKRVEAIFTNN